MKTLSIILFLTSMGLFIAVDWKIALGVWLFGWALSLNNI